MLGVFERFREEKTFSRVKITLLVHTGKVLSGYVPVVLMEFQIRGSVAQVCPRCWGRNPKSISRPLPNGISASAIWLRSLSSPSNHPDRSTFSLAYRAITRTFWSVVLNAELLMK